MSQVHVAKPVAVDGLCYLNLLILFQQNVTYIINQEKQCSKFVTMLVYFTKRLSFKTYENLYWTQFSLISLELVGLTLLKVYNKISLNLLQSSWFQIQYNAVSAKFIELSLCWRVTNLHHITVTITIITKCTRFTKPHYIIAKIDLYKDKGCSTLIFLQRAQCSHCKRCISCGNSVCPSVCPSVRPSVRHTTVLCQNGGTQHGAVCTVG